MQLLERDTMRPANPPKARDSHSLVRQGWLRHVPPAAVPIAAGDLLEGARSALAPDAARERFRTAVAAYTGAKTCHLFSSGRAALTAILLTLRQLSPRRQVVVPAYCCPTVVQAVLAADLSPLFCDVSPQTLALEPRQLAALVSQEPLAIITAYLYGLVHDISNLLETGRARAIFIVEDAAQAFGASLSGQRVGTLGDFGLYSLGRGKGIPAGHGGVLLAKAPYAPAVAETVARESVRRGRRGAAALAAYLAYGLATTPLGWWFVARSPLNPAPNGRDVGRLPPILLDGLSATEAGIGRAILARLEPIVATRRHNARRLAALLTRFEFVRVPEGPPGGEPVFLRFPLIADSEARADALFRRLADAGIGVSRSYGHTLPELFADRVSNSGGAYPGATRLARCLLTLPTNHRLRERDVATIARILTSLERDKE